VCDRHPIIRTAGVRSSLKSTRPTPFPLPGNPTSPLIPLVGTPPPDPKPGSGSRRGRGGKGVARSEKIVLGRPRAAGIS